MACPPGRRCDRPGARLDRRRHRIGDVGAAPRWWPTQAPVTADDQRRRAAPIAVGASRSRWDFLQWRCTRCPVISGVPGWSCGRSAA